MMKDKRSAAKILYNGNFEQKEIARILKLSEQTISKYSTEDNWKANRLKHSLARETSEENALIALSFQTKIIRLISEKREAKINDDLDEIELGKLLIPKGEIDAVQKLFTTVKGKELDWSGMVQIIRNFMNYLKETDLELSQDIVPHVDTYINLKRRQL